LHFFISTNNDIFSAFLQVSVYIETVNTHQSGTLSVSYSIVEKKNVKR